MCLCSLTDKTSDSGSDNGGSNPLEGTLLFLLSPKLF